jgi:tRNA(Ile)-lysidine synthase
MNVRARVEGMVARAARRYQLWAPGARLLLAVSGGPDSLCLLGAMTALMERHHPIAPSAVVVAHFDHGLRSEEGAADAAWVTRFAQEDLGLECVVERADVRTLARAQHRSLEDTARRVRYAFLRRAATQAHCDRICVGHTRDDQAETVVMHFLRGSGLAGLAGMPPLRGDIARPLLDLSRADTAAYCAARGWTPRIDASNADPAFMRNRVRTDLLPGLEVYNPNLHQTLVRNAALLADDERLLESLAAAAWPHVLVEHDSTSVALARTSLNELAPALRHRVLRRAAQRLTDVESGLAAASLLALDDLVDRGTTGAAVDLPGGLRARLDYATLVFVRHPVRSTRRSASAPAQAGEPGARWRLSVPGVLELHELGWRLRAWHTDLPAGVDPVGTPPAPQSILSHAGLAGALARAELRAYLDADAAGSELFVRTWRPGDRIRPLGMTHDKKVQDVFTDAKVPRALRQRLPLVYSGERLIWLTGVRIAASVRVTPDTRRILALQLESLDAPASACPSQSSGDTS